MSILTLLTKILFVGQSLVGPDLFSWVQAGLVAMGQQAEGRAHDGDGRSELACGGTDVMVLMGQDQPEAAVLASVAWAANLQAQAFVTETWPNLTTGTGMGLNRRDPLAKDLA